MDLRSSGYHQIYTFDTPEDTAISIADSIIEQTQSIIERNGKCVWGVSGGSTILKFYDALFAHKKQIDEFGEDLIVFWVDERLVPHSHKSSNYGISYEYFWKKMKEVQLIPVTYNKSSNKSRKEYDQVLSEKGILTGTVDITVLGMGSDGHTASLFPKNPALKEKKKKIVAVEDPFVRLPRISMTFSFINSSDSIYLLFFGKEKAETFQRAISSGSIYKYPILGVEKDKLRIYTDNKLLTNE